MLSRRQPYHHHHQQQQPRGSGMDSSGAVAADLEMQSMRSAGGPAPASSSVSASIGAPSEADSAAPRMDALTALPVSTPPRPVQLRVSPFVFFLIPAIFFYLSAVFASFTLHFSGDGSGHADISGLSSSDAEIVIARAASCPSALRMFLWGAVLLGYAFLLAFAWLVAGPRVSSPRLKWLALAVYVGALGALTALGARIQLRDGAEAPSASCRDSVRFGMCAFITAFYCLCWLAMAALGVAELGFRCCCPPRGKRVVVMGVGAGMEKLRLRDLAPVDAPILRALAARFPKFPPPVSPTKPTAVAQPTSQRNPSQDTTLRDQSRESSSLLSGERPPRQDQNFFGGPASSAAEEEKKPSLQSKRSLSERFTFGSSNNAVAPAPSAAAADPDPALDGEDTPTKRRRKLKERQQAEAAAAAEALLGGGTQQAVQGDLVGGSGGSLLAEFNAASASSSQPSRVGTDPLLGPTPAQRNLLLPPLAGTTRVGANNQVSDSSLLLRSSSDDDDDDAGEDPIALFERKIAANNAAAAQRKQELAEIERQQSHLRPLPAPLPPLVIPPSLAPSPVAGGGGGGGVPRPVSGILKQPSSAMSPLGDPLATTGTFKMVEFERGSRLEHVQPPPPPFEGPASDRDSHRSNEDGNQEAGNWLLGDPYAPPSAGSSSSTALRPMRPLGPGFSYAQGPAPLPPMFSHMAPYPQASVGFSGDPVATSATVGLYPAGLQRSPDGGLAMAPAAGQQWPPPPPVGPSQQQHQQAAFAAPGAQIALGGGRPLGAGAWVQPPTPGVGLWPPPPPPPHQQPADPRRYDTILDSPQSPYY